MQCGSAERTLNVSRFRSATQKECEGMLPLILANLTAQKECEGMLPLNLANLTAQKECEGMLPLTLANLTAQKKRLIQPGAGAP